MDWLAAVIEAADSPGGITVVFLLGLTAILWRHGGQLLTIYEQKREKQDDADSAE